MVSRHVHARLGRATHLGATRLIVVIATFRWTLGVVLGLFRASGRLRPSVTAFERTYTRSSSQTTGSKSCFSLASNEL